MSPATAPDVPNLVSVSTIAARLKRGPDGKPTCSRAVRNWIRVGLLDPSGQRVRLPARRLGNSLMVDPGDFDAFLARVSPPRP